LKSLSYFYFRKPEPIVSDDVEVLGLKFLNRLGLAAGMDKNADYVDPLSYLGFGFIELGTLTPKAQVGNLKPRLFRLAKERSLINRMGFNNKGIDHAVKKIKNSNSKAVIGLSIGKSFDTPLDKAVEDYLFCLERAYPVCDYIAVNISSPNTKDLRKLESKKYFSNLISSLKKQQKILSRDFGYKPIILKLSPDLQERELENICKEILDKDIDAIICSNTTTSHNYSQSGGLSGEELFEISNRSLVSFRSFLGSSFPIIASGGVMSRHHFKKKLELGADLVQVYTGMIYKGPALVKDILNS
jgi:dihydroorotate dehydrogenase